VDGTGNGSGVWSTGPVNKFGVFGEAMGSGYGVYGYNGGSGCGVYGYNHSGGYAGYFDGPAFTNSGMWSGSDARLKKEIHDATHGLTQVLKMHPVTYKWKSGGDETVQLGFIAQDIQKIVPEVVHADGRTQMLSINYPALLPVVVKAAQEQQQIIQRLEDRIARLERGNKPLSYSLPAGGIGLGVAFGLLPLGLFVANRRRKEPKV
jgi:Chaperone of endosialidase